MTEKVADTSASGQRSAEELSANVVDIRRFSTHDGQGIRTTIFLKGCSLECAWCQNPEAISPRIHPIFFRSRCINCGLCIGPQTSAAVCRDADGQILVDSSVSGVDWEELTRICPTGAIAFDARRYTVSELVRIAERDRVFFGSGGGVTLSGGEPLFLPHFAAALLRALGEAGLHTAIETALNVRTEFLLESATLADHIFADCKLISPPEHLRYTGHDNKQILHNLAELLSGQWRDKVTVRTPLIPGITDSEQNIAGIARFISGIHPGVRYELLNYNPLAAAKYDLLPGVTYVFDTDQNPRMFSRAQMADFRQLARDNGVQNLIES